MIPTIRQFEAFVRAAHLGSFVRAADKLGLSQPAFSQTIAQLEKQLGTKLFERTSRSLRLTPEGEFLLPRAERLLNDMAETIRDFQEAAEGHRMRLSVGALPLLAAHVLAPLVEEFGRQHPQVQIAVEDAHAEALNRGIELDKLDLALSIRPEGRPELAFQPVFRDQFLVVLRQNHPLAAAKLLRWQDLETDNFLYFRPGSGGQATLLKALAAAGVTLRPRLELHQSWTLLAMVDAGLGFTVLPKMSCRLGAYPRLCCRGIEEPVVEREVGLVSAARRSLTVPALAFKEMVFHFVESHKGDVVAMPGVGRRERE
jgi:LysR family carnitine catabolism transcriptional activator